MCSAVENNRLSLTAPINPSLARREIVYFPCAENKLFCKPIPDLFSINVLRAPTIQRRVSISKENTTQKVFPHNVSHLFESLCHFLSHTLKKNPLQLNHMGQCGIPLLRIFIGRFSESTSLSLPFTLALFEPTPFCFFIPDITPYITCTRAHLKSMTLPKFLSRFKVLWIHN